MPVEKYKRLVGITSDFSCHSTYLYMFFSVNSVCLKRKGASSSAVSPRNGASIFQLRGQCGTTVYYRLGIALITVTSIKINVMT